MAPTANLRMASKVVKGMKLMEGAGVQICRTIGTPSIRNLDPFLMLDELRLPAESAAAGFPDHPHRGFSTCSIMLSGRMEHRDSQGNAGVIGAGGVQFMTAGRGIIHSEMPVVEGGEMLHGFQLWVNLPAKDKMCKPRYQDYQPTDIPTVDTGGGARARVLAGDGALGLAATGPVELRHPGLLLDVILAPGAKAAQRVPAGFNAFAYVYAGSGSVGGAKAGRENLVVLPLTSGDGNDNEDGAETVEFEAGPEGLSFLLAAGQPINEPVVQHGPFVMNTREEIMQAFQDYSAGRLQRKEDDVWAKDEL